MSKTRSSRKGAKAQRDAGLNHSIKSFLHIVPLCVFASLREMSFRSLLVLLCLISLASCRADKNQQIGIPPAAQATIENVTADIAAGQDEKIYQEAAEEWRQSSTLEETKDFFKTFRTKLGAVRNRVYHTARVETKKGGAVPEQMLIAQYQTSFERAEGMETFTLVERDGRWLLARYFVSSDALK